MVKKKEVKKYYDMLEVSHKASYEEVRKSYERLIHLYTDDSIVISPIEEEFSDNQKKEIIDSLENAFAQIKRYLKIEPADDEKVEEKKDEPEIIEEESPEETEKEEIFSEGISVKENIIEITFDDEINQDMMLSDNADPQDGSVIFEDISKEKDFEPEEFEDTLKEEPMVEVASPDQADIRDVAAEDEKGEKMKSDAGDEDTASEDEQGGVEDVPFEEETETAMAEDSAEEIEEEEVPETEVTDPEKDMTEEEGNETVQAPVVEIDLGKSEETGSLSLKEAREKMGFKVHDIGVALNIPYKILVNIEMEKFHKLPEDGYLRWYITTYAKYLTLDSKAIADDYMKRYREWKKSRESS